MPGLATISELPVYDNSKFPAEILKSGTGGDHFFEKTTRLGTPIPRLHQHQQQQFPGIILVSPRAVPVPAAPEKPDSCFLTRVPTHLFLTNNNNNINNTNGTNNYFKNNCGIRARHCTCSGGGGGRGDFFGANASGGGGVINGIHNKNNRNINIYEHIVCPEVTETGGGALAALNGRSRSEMEKIANFRDRVSVTQVEMPRKDIWRALGAEFISTFILMVIGVGVCMHTDESDKPSLLSIAFTWGFTVASLAQAFGHASGCHMNPAVTIALLVARKIELVKSCLYIVTQCISAIVACVFLKALLPETMQGGWGVITVHKSLTPLQGFGLEFLMTFLLLFMIFAQSDENRTDVAGSNPLAVGVLLIVLILFGGNWTGTGLNPARALGPAVVEGQWDSQWVYWVGPIGGALVAAVLYENVFRALRPDEVEAAQIAKQIRAREEEEKESAMPPPV